MEILKYGLLVVSLFALIKLGLAKRAGSMLRAFLSRFGVLVFALAVLGIPVTFGSVRTAAAVGACSAVIPVDALAGSVFGTGAVGAFSVGTINAPVAVVAGGAAPVAATAGTVGLAAAAFLGSVYGTCKFLDVVYGDVAAFSPAVLGPSTTAWGAVHPCAWFFPGAMPSDPYGQTTTVCRKMTFTAQNPFSGNEDFGSTRGSTVSSAGVTLSPPNYSKPWVTGCFLAASCAVADRVAGDYKGSDGRPSWLSAAGTHWCTNTYPQAGCSIGTNFNATGSILFSFECGNHSQTSDQSQWVGNVGNVCGHVPGEVLWSTSEADPNGGFHIVMPAWQEAVESGWQRRTVVDVYCAGAGAGWVRSESALYWDKFPSERLETPSCATGQKATAINAWRVPANVTCAVGASLCWQYEAAVFKWQAPSSWSTASAPDWSGCLAAGSVCGAPAMVNGACQWGGFAVPASYCTGTQLEPSTVGAPQAAGTTSPATCTGICPTTDTAPVPPSTTIPAGGGGVPIDPGTGQNPPGAPDDGGDSPCVPTGWGWLNPVQWVLKPVKCAMVWAFVPDPQVVQDAWTGLVADAATHAPIAWAYQAHAVVVQAAAGTQAAVTANRDGCITMVPAGGPLVQSTAGQVCPSAMDVGVLGTARPWLGLMVWLGWAWSMYGAMFRKAPASSEPQQLSLF